jgi:hypothetical protein
MALTERDVLKALAFAMGEEVVPDNQTSRDLAKKIADVFTSRVYMERRRAYAQIYFDGSHVVNITTVNTPVKIDVSTLENDTPSNRFTVEPGRLTSKIPEGDIDPYPGVYFVTGTIITTGAVNDRLHMYIAKNGVIKPLTKGVVRVSAAGGADTRQTIVQGLMVLEENDYVEIWGENASDTDNFTVTGMTLIAHSV